jgi:CheY-like chemotaxis protein
LRVVTSLATEDCRLAGDTPRLTQVFWNLLHNAAKFTPDGGTIIVRSRREPAAEQGPDWLVVEVSDTGIGIEDNTLTHIFDPFDQGSPETASRYGGLGLGLAICKTIVQMHGGSLDALSSGRNQGATFIVRLPVTDLPAAAAREPSLSAQSGAWATDSPHILLVEDHADTAAAMADLLRGLGYEITVATSVAEGLAAAEQCQAGRKIDLVVSDLGLPDGTGLDLMRTLAQRYQLRGIALSGYGMEEDLQNSRDAGFEKHLTKPVSLQALETALRGVLEPQPSLPYPSLPRGERE